MLSMKWNAVALVIGLVLMMSCVTISAVLAQADRQGLLEGVDYVLAVEGDVVPWDGVVMTREAMDRLLNERDWLLDRIAAHERARIFSDELITLKEAQLESYRKDLRGARWEKWAWQGTTFLFTGIALNSALRE